MFGQTTNTPLPPEYLTSYAAWDDYMARVWLSLMESVSPAPKGYVIEIACGASQKIGKALAKSGFSGEFYVVDPCEASLTATCSAYRSMMPLARIAPVTGRFEDAMDHLPPSPEWIVANHPLDDMLLAYNATDAEMEAMFSPDESPTADVRESVTARWQMLWPDKPQLKEAQQQIVTTFSHALKTLSPGVIAISQYNSAALSARPSVQTLNDAAAETLHMLRMALPLTIPGDIQRTLNQHPNHDTSYIGNEVLNADRWLVGTAS